MLTVHHLQNSQSERIVWLCEELGIPYELKLYKRDPLLSPPALKSMTPMGSAPVITESGGLTLSESGAVVEYIVHRYGSGKLILPPSHPSYPDYLYWFHFANSNLQPAFLSGLRIQHNAIGSDQPIYKQHVNNINKVLRVLDDRLSKVPWLAGEQFTAADIMTVFSLTTMRVFVSQDLSEYDNILVYLRRVGERKSYMAAMTKGDPDLVPCLDGAAPPLFSGFPMKK
jgi:glutathione S-transferase